MRMLKGATVPPKVTILLLAEFAARRNITFPLLSDQGSVVIKQYGILNTTVAPASATYGIPFPGTFIVDAEGVVTSRHFETAYQERDTITSELSVGEKTLVSSIRSVILNFCSQPHCLRLES